MRTKAFAQPSVESQVIVGRHQRRVVVTCDRVNIVAARRLQPNRDVATPKGRNREAVAIKRVSPVKWVGFRRSPLIEDLVTDGAGQRSEKQAVIGKREALFDSAITPARVGGSVSEARYQVCLLYTSPSPRDRG